MQDWIVKLLVGVLSFISGILVKTYVFNGSKKIKITQKAKGESVNQRVNNVGNEK